MDKKKAKWCFTGKEGHAILEKKFSGNKGRKFSYSSDNIMMKKNN